MCSPHLILSKNGRRYHDIKHTYIHIDVVDNLRADLDKNMICILVLLDHSKAFDTVDHYILLKKLEKFSTSRKQLVDYYGRSQIVSYNGTCSESLDVDRGVPQGSVLLFIY